MAKRVNRIRHITATANSFVGKDGEITVDSTLGTIRVHDDATPGGQASAREDLNNTQDASVSGHGRMSSAHAALLSATAGTPAASKTVIMGAGNSLVSLNINSGGLQLNSVPITATAAELNIMDGVVASTAELNTMNGIVASTAELNVLNGITASTAELNLLTGKTLASADNVIDNFPAGTAMLFYQAAAPAGWTTVSLDTEDSTIRVANTGSGADNWASGVTGTHGINSPPATAHIHQWHNDNGAGAPQVYNSGGSANTISGGTGMSGNRLTVAGSGTGLAEDGYTTSVGPAAFAPKYIDTILCSKN